MGILSRIVGTIVGTCAVYKASVASVRLLGLALPAALIEDLAVVLRVALRWKRFCQLNFAIALSCAIHGNLIVFFRQD
jgi:hypothetical protein